MVTSHSTRWIISVKLAKFTIFILKEIKDWFLNDI